MNDDEAYDSVRELICDYVEGLPGEADDDAIIMFIVDVMPRTATVDDFCAMCEDFLPEGSKVTVYGNGAITVIYSPPSWIVPAEWTLSDLDAMQVKH